MKTDSKAYSRTSLSMAVAAAVLAAMPSYAQNAPLVLEEVIVTAQKREQSMQQVPVSVTAITAAMIEEAGIETTEDIVRVAPSLTFTGNINKQGQAFSVRGIGTNTFGINVEQSVAFIIDDVATVQQGESIENLSDIERIEVLRGPQSTLFGKSASAGAIVITTKSPAEEFEGTVEGTVTDDEEYRLTGSVSGPMGDAWGYRLSGYWTDREGYIDNLYNGDDLNGTENYGVRGKLRWDINSSVEATLTAYYNKDDDSCCQLTLREIGDDAMLFGLIPLDFTGIKPGDDNDAVRADLNADGDTETTGGNLRFDAGLGEHTLVSITAVNNWEYERTTDIDGWDVDIADLVGSGSGGMYENSDLDSDFFSQEFRLLSPGGGSYEYLLGLYYADADTDRHFDRNIDPDIPFVQTLADASAGTETTAVYGQLTWFASNSINVTGGLRYHYEEIYGEYTDLLTNEGKVRGDDDDSEVVGKLALQYFIDDETMLFASYATGYKGQAFDVTVGFDEEKAANPVEPETSDSIELGVKGRFFDQRLQFNATAYWAEYDDFQAQSLTLLAFGEADFDLVNVGQLDTYGLEIESTALLSESLTLTLNAAYMDAEVNDYDGAQCWPGQSAAQGCIDGSQDVDGGTLPSAPDWKFAAFLDYRHELDKQPFDAFVGVNYSWQDEVTFDINQDPNLYQDSYGIANLRVGINDKAYRYQITAFVNNLFDEQYTSGMRNGSALYNTNPQNLTTFAFSQMLPRNSFRYWGVTAQYNF